MPQHIRKSMIQFSKQAPKTKQPTYPNTLDRNRFFAIGERLRREQNQTAKNFKISKAIDNANSLLNISAVPWSKDEDGMLYRCVQTSIEYNVSTKRRLLAEHSQEPFPDCSRGADDLSIRTGDQEVLTFRSDILALTSRYFSAYNGWTDSWNQSSPKLIEVQEPKIVLLQALKFLRTGRIVLNDQNVEAIFSIANFLQIDGLIAVCLHYLKKNGLNLMQLCIELHELYDLQIIIENLIDQILDFPRKPRRDSITDLLERFNAKQWVTLLKKDDLQVENEDEVVKILLEYAKPEVMNGEETQAVVDCIRLPHLSLHCFNALETVFPNCEITNYKLCRDGAPRDWPKEQLRPRAFYIRHLHVVWNDETPKQRMPNDFKTTCLRWSHQNELLGNVDLFRFSSLQMREEEQSSFQFLTVGNHLVRVSQNYRKDKFFVNVLRPNLRYDRIAVVLIPNVVTWTVPPGVCATVRGSKLLVVYYNGDSDRYEAMGFDSDNDWERTTDEAFQPECRMLSHGVLVYEDEVLSYNYQRIVLYNRESKESKFIELDDISGSITDVVKFKGLIYVYENRNHRRYTHPDEHDRIYRIHPGTCQILGSSYVIDVGDTGFSRLSDEPARLTRRFLATEHELLILCQNDAGEKFRVLQFDTDKLKAKPMIWIRCDQLPSPVDNSIIPKRAFQELIPTYLSSCRHETMLDVRTRFFNM